MPDRISDFLESCGARRRRHSGRSLYEHLRGTERLLRNWNCAEETCLAGLFHSIYGTNAFRHSSLDTSRRAILVELIGARAEQLVYLFHACERPRALLDALRLHGVVSRLNGRFLELTEPDLTSLVEVECANLMEQDSGWRFFSTLMYELKINPLPGLSAEAMRSVTLMHA